MPIGQLRPNVLTNSSQPSVYIVGDSHIQYPSWLFVKLEKYVNYCHENGINGIKQRRGNRDLEHGFQSKTSSKLTEI